jgi:hypothetical protein
MDKINMTTFGEVEVIKPPLSTCFDIVSMWSDEQTRAAMGRVCAMALCICLNDYRLPKVRHLVDVHKYGSTCLDTLLGAGVPVNEILEIGMMCIGVMAKSLPSSHEVQETENFTEPPPVDP